MRPKADQVVELSAVQVNALVTTAVPEVGQDCLSCVFPLVPWNLAGSWQGSSLGREGAARQLPVPSSFYLCSWGSPAV